MSDPVKPTIGRIVHVVVRKGDTGTPDIVRPAIITAVWGDTCVNVRLFSDGSNDVINRVGPADWLTSLSQGSGLFEWDWPPRV